MPELRLLPGERLESELAPHPTAWIGRYLAASYPAILAVALAAMFRTAWWQGAGEGAWYEVWRFAYGGTAAAWAYMFAGLALMGAVVAVVAVSWRTFLLYVAAGLAVAAVAYVSPWSAQRDIPLLLALTAAPALTWSELARRSHRYTLTNLRIVFAGGPLVRRERQLEYEAVTDLDGSQGVLGRMLDVGTLIPVTRSGLGSDGQAGTVAGGGNRGGLLGGPVMAGGGDVRAARAKTFHQLTGIRPYGETKHLLVQLIQEATSTPYLREQVGL